MVVDCTLFQFWKTEVIGKLYLVRSAYENVGGSVVDIFWESEEIGKPYYVRSPLTKTWVIRWLTYFGKTQEIVKPYCVRSANETRVVRWVVIWFLVLVSGFRDSIYLGCELRRQGGRSGEA